MADPQDAAITVDVPTLGTVSFPAGTSETDMKKAIDTQLAQKHVQAGEAVPHPIAARLLEWLPAVGGMVGGAVGGTSGAAALGIGAVPGAIGGAIAGGAAGRTIENTANAYLGNPAPKTIPEAMQSVGNAGLTQGANEVVGQGAGKVAAKAADVLDRSATNSMIRALGPAGGRGPTGDINLRSAEAIAPRLVKQGFTPLTQTAARAQAADAVKTATPELTAMLNQYGGATFDQPGLLRQIQQSRAALTVPGAGGQPFLPTQTAARDVLLAGLEADVTNLGPRPTAEAAHTLKSKWNDIVNFNASDPQAGSLTAVYRKGGDWIRAIMRNDHPEISKADAAFHQAETLHTVLNAATARRPGAGMAAAVAPYAVPATAIIGGGVGYQEGGVGGAAAGAATGALAGTAGVAALSKLIGSPGFRYLSAAMKSKLAEVLDSGNQQAIARLVAGATAQATRLATAKGEAAQ